MFFGVFAIGIAMLTGCSCSRQSESGFQAYYEPLSSEDIAREGDIYYASSRLLLTATGDASYNDIKKLADGLDGEIIGYISTTNDYEIYFPDGKNYGDLEQLVHEWNASVFPWEWYHPLKGYDFVTFYYEYNFSITEDNIQLMLENPEAVTLK